MDNKEHHKINRYFFLAIIIIFAGFLIFSLAQFFTAFLASVLLYVLTKPTMVWLTQKKRWKKSWATILVILISFFIILLPVSLFASLLYGKIHPVVQNPQQIIDVVNKVAFFLNEKLGISIMSADYAAKIQTTASGILSAILNQTLNLFTTIIMMYFFLYFLLVNSSRMEAALIFYLPFERDKIKMFGDELVAQTFSNAIGVPLIAVVQGFLGFVVYSIVGVKEPGFWGVITGFSSIIPVVGTGLVWAPVAAYLLISGDNWQGIFVIGWGFLILGISDNIVRFVLARRMADVHPIVTVLGVILGLNYFGITGLIFGPLLISYFIILLRIYYLEYQKPINQRPVKKRQLMPTYMQPFLGIKGVKKKP